MVKIGIIGGSGLDNPDILKEVKEISVKTTYGSPSSTLKIGKIEGMDVVLLARHGRKHEIPPTQVNNRANIYTLKRLGCTHIIATTAVGSLRKQINRGHLVIPDQFIDFTRHRRVTFFDRFAPGAENAKHTSMEDPFNERLRKVLIETCKKLKLKYHPKGTVITIEGPRFSTRAESKMFRVWGADVINMSIAPEAILANELNIPYAAVAMSTDYDSWFLEEKPVTWNQILKIFKKNSQNVTNLITKSVPKIR